MKTIIYDLDGGEIEKGVNLVTAWEEESSRELPVPAKEGYIFTKWVDNDGRRIFSLDPCRIRDGITLTACYTEDLTTIEDDVPPKRKGGRKAKEEVIIEDVLKDTFEEEIREEENIFETI